MLQAGCQLTPEQRQDLLALRSTYLVRWAHLEQQRQQAPLQALLPQASSSSDGSASSNSGDCCMVCSSCWVGWTTPAAMQGQHCGAPHCLICVLLGLFVICGCRRHHLDRAAAVV